MKKIKIACVGAGYFARFQVEAWKRIPEVELMAICDRDLTKAQRMAHEFGVPHIYQDFSTLLHDQEIEVVDLITPPETHLSLIRETLNKGKHLICQKPLAPTLAEAKEIEKLVQGSGLRFMVHENFRFQPWYRKIKKILSEGLIGNQVHQLYFRMRMGDGWGDNAYLDRQPYFQTMPRLLIYETGIHFIDTFRFLLGEVDRVYARLRKLNPVIAGEDAGLVIFQFQNGCQVIWDASRYHDPPQGNPRYTFGELALEGNLGTLRMDLSGHLSFQALGEAPYAIHYPHEIRNFASDCVYHTQKHFVEAFLGQYRFETEVDDYLTNLLIQEAIYKSSRTGREILVKNDS